MTDSFDHSKLAELPAECSLLAISNAFGLCFIGDEQCKHSYNFESTTIGLILGIIFNSS